MSHYLLEIDDALPRYSDRQTVGRLNVAVAQIAKLPLSLMSLWSLRTEVTVGPTTTARRGREASITVTGDRSAVPGTDKR